MNGECTPCVADPLVPEYVSQNHKLVAGREFAIHHKLTPTKPRLDIALLSFKGLFHEEEEQVVLAVIQTVLITYLSTRCWAPMRYTDLKLEESPIYLSLLRQLERSVD